MNVKKIMVPALITAAGLAVVSLVIAEPTKEASSGDQPQVQLPPGWSEKDMQACMIAGTPGKMHEKLAESAGVWEGETTMWMFPGADPTKSPCTSTVTSIMDGRFVRVEMKSEMPGMGPYHGLGFYGFDNVSKKFVSTWLDNHMTGMSHGTGKLSADEKTLNWEYVANCPLTGKPEVMREIVTFTSPDSQTLEMYGNDPKSGKEFKIMHIDLKRTSKKVTSAH